jgi:hypothetical protein
MEDLVVGGLLAPPNLGDASAIGNCFDKTMTIDLIMSNGHPKVGTMAGDPNLAGEGVREGVELKFEIVSIRLQLLSREG